MIDNELLDKVIYVSSKNKFISKKLLKRIVINVIDNSDPLTKSMFNDIVFKEMEWEFAGAVCDKENGIIEADYDSIIVEQSLAPKDSYLKMNLEIIRYVLHEVEHLKEEYKKSLNNYKSKIIKYSDNIFISKNFYTKTKNKPKKIRRKIVHNKFQKFCEKNWDIIPTERIADIDSYYNVIESLKAYDDFKNKYKLEYIDTYNEFIDILKQGYVLKDDGEYNTPVFDYFINIKRTECLNKLGFSLNKEPNGIENLSLTKKFVYGFPITNEDMYNLDKKKILTRR